MKVDNTGIGYKIFSIPGLLLIAIIEKLINKFQTPRPYHQVSQFSFLQKIEDSFDVIEAELNGVLSYQKNIPEFSTLSHEQKRIINGSWKTFFLKTYGYKDHFNSKLCPKTAALVDQIPEITTAMFSILGPQSKIAPHRGPFNGVLRYHLPFIVPNNSQACFIEVDGVRHHWNKGIPIIFDDTFEHSAENGSDESRVVLFVDFKRPLPFFLGIIREVVIWLIGVSPFIQNQLKNSKKWNCRSKN